MSVSTRNAPGAQDRYQRTMTRSARALAAILVLTLVGAGGAATLRLTLPVGAR